MTSPVEIVVCPACRALYRLPAGRDDGRLRCGRCHERFTLAEARRLAHEQETGAGAAGTGHLHRYQVIGRIARGGMGEVVRARDGELERDVALKTMLRPRQATLRARFLAEARLTGQLDHPNIVPVHELGADDQGRPFFAMKLIEGRSLADVIAGLRDGDAAICERWTLPRLLTVFIGVCNGVAYAHDRDIVHRDLKPANVMLGSFGEVWVLDWGLAKRLRPAAAGTGRAVAKADADAADEGTDADRPIATSPVAPPAPLPSPSPAEAPTLIANGGSGSELTLDGHVLGTPAFMAPEQARGEHALVDQRSDVWALGAMLYEILALRHARPGHGSREHLEAARAGVVRRLTVKSGRRSVPPELIAVVEKAMAADRDQRYQRVTDLRADIEAWLDRRAVSAHHETIWQALWRLGRRHTAAVVAANLVLAVLLAAAAVVGVQELNRRSERRRAIPAFVAMAHAAIERRDYADALFAANAALAAEPGRSDARLAGVHARIGLGDWTGASAAAAMLAADGDPGHIELARLCRQGLIRPTKEIAEPLAVLLGRQGAGRLAEHLLAGSKAEFDRCRERLTAAYPGHVLAPAADGGLDLDLARVARVGDLEALAGMPLTGLRLGGLQRRGDKVISLAPLAGMRLARLDIAGSDVVDLSPLAGMPLTALNLTGTRVRDLSPLAGTPLTSLVLAQCPLIEDLAALRGLPLAELDCTGCARIADLGALAGAPLRKLLLAGTAVASGAGLEGAPLETLALDGTRVADLAFLAGAPLRTLSLANCPVGDVQPLAGAPLETLSLRGCARVADIAPLAQARLHQLDLSATLVGDLAPLAGQPIVALSLPATANDAANRDVLVAMPRLARINGLPARDWLAAEARRSSAGARK